MTVETAIAPIAPGQVARQEFGVQQLSVQGETAASAVAAQLQASIQARYVMALQRPRDWDDVRVRVMRELERPGFAEAAWFRKPIGAGVEGFSVRFTDAATLIMRNILDEATMIYDDPHKRVVRVAVTDLEANVPKIKDVTIEKTVERSSLKDGRVALAVRTNSRGQPVYTVPATDDELLAKENAICAKARRALVLQILPGDIQDAARTRIQEIRNGAVAQDPDAARRKVIAAFALLNVQPSDLRAYLGHDVAQCSPSEIQDLRDVYSTIADGSTSWAEVIADKRGGGDETKTKAGVEGLKEKLKGSATAE